MSTNFEHFEQKKWGIEEKQYLIYYLNCVCDNSIYDFKKNQIFRNVLFTIHLGNFENKYNGFYRKGSFIKHTFQFIKLEIGYLTTRYLICLIKFYFDNIKTIRIS